MLASAVVMVGGGRDVCGLCHFNMRQVFPSPMGHMVQAWVAHFVTPLKLSTTDESQVRNRTKSTNNMTNNITMVLEPLAHPAAWI